MQSPVDFHETRRNDWRRQGNECTTLWGRSGGHPDLDQSGKPDSNPRLLSGTL